MDDVVTICETDSGSDFSDHTSEIGAGVFDLKSGSAQSLNDETAAEVLDSSKIVEDMTSTLSNIADIIGEDHTVTRLLLSHFHWDTQALLERFYEKEKNELFTEANIDLPTGNDSENTSNIPALETPSSGTLTTSTQLSKESGDLAETISDDCGICLLPLEDKNFNLSCGHNFCTECWQAYLNHNITSEGMSQNITCAAYRCNRLVSDATVMDLVAEDKVKSKYRQSISRSYVNCNKRLRWCPGKGCDKVIKADEGSRQVTCSCGEHFCFQCGERWHNPIQCSWVRDWNCKCSTDSSTTSWLASNTKECPKCNATIEKDGGCNHMTCRTESCRYEFCWVCMGSWQEHGQNAWYRCNRFNEQSSKDARTAMEKSRASMLRFLHYYSRFANHEQSMKLESDLYNKVNSKITELRVGQGRAWNEVKYLNVAVDVLCRARQILMNTYIFAYFVEQNNQSMMFEDNQRDLELATEQLSEYMERDIYKDGIEGLKQKVTDKTNYCRKRCAVLVSHVQEGYECGWWKMCEERRRGPTIA